METFNELLSEVIKQNESSFSQISRQTGISRSTLTRLVRGESTEQILLLESILRVLPRCDYSMHQKLYRALHNEAMEWRYGKGAWKCIEEVRNLLSLRYPTIRLRVDCPSELVSINQIITGRANVRTALQEFFFETARQEKVEVAFWGTAQPDLFYDCLTAFDGHSAHIRHLVTLVSGANNEYSLYNLRCMESILPCLCSPIQYEVKSFYVENIPSNIGGPFSIFILTSKAIAEISSNYDGMQVIREKKAVQFYWDIFNKKYEQGRILAEQNLEMQEWECDFQENKKKQQDGYLILDHMLTEDTGLEATLIRERRAYMSKETKKCLSSYLTALEEKYGKKVELQILDDHSFNVSPGLTLCCMNESAVLFSYQRANEKLVTFSVSDVGIAKWFYRFLNFLPNSGWIYSMEYKRDILLENDEG